MDEWLLFSSVLHFHISTPRIFSDFPAFPAATAFSANAACDDAVFRKSQATLASEKSKAGNEKWHV